EIVWTGSPSGQDQGVTAKNAVDDWLGRMAVNKEMVCETPAMQPKHFRGKISRGGPLPEPQFAICHSPSPFAWRRTCSTQACSGENAARHAGHMGARVEHMRGWRLRF